MSIDAPFQTLVRLGSAGSFCIFDRSKLLQESTRVQCKDLLQETPVRRFLTFLPRCLQEKRKSFREENAEGCLRSYTAIPQIIIHPKNMQFMERLAILLLS